jgi:hypothetical protein
MLFYKFLLFYFYFGCVSSTEHSCVAIGRAQQLAIGRGQQLAIGRAHPRPATDKKK